MRENKTLIDYFGEASFDSENYAREMFEHGPIEIAMKKVQELEALKKGTEDDLQHELLNNYQLFLCALEEIQGMKSDMRQLKEFLALSSEILSSFESIHFTGWGTNGEEEDVQQSSDASLTHHSTRLPEWLDKSPAVLEELIIEHKNELACNLILRVRKFKEGVSDLAHLTPGACETVATVEVLAKELVQRLLGEIYEVSSITPWGFREHRRNFALLIELGYADSAAESLVAERSALIRRSLCMIQITADPLTRVCVVSSTFFEQTADCVRAFLYLFCGPARQIASKTKTYHGTDEDASSEYLKVIAGVQLCGTAPFCRLISWVDEELAEYAHLIGQQFLIVGAPLARSAAGLDRTVKLSDKKIHCPLIGEIALPTFEVVSTILNRVFKHAESLASLGLPVVPTLAARLSTHLAVFLKQYVECVEGNLERHITEELYIKELTESYLIPLSMELYPQIAECIVKLLSVFMRRYPEAAEESTAEKVEAMGLCLNSFADIIIPEIELWIKRMSPWAHVDEVTKLEKIKQNYHQTTEDLRCHIGTDSSKE